MKKACLFIMLLVFVSHLDAKDSQKASPAEYVFATHGKITLKAYVFTPEPVKNQGPRPAIVIFHGGGWTIGEPAWSFKRAKHFRDLGMVAVAAQYRLSDENAITPIEAMADAREVIKWMRANSNSLHIDPNKIAAYGWSAGAHLAASAAVFNEPLSSPDALVLVSPAVSLRRYGDSFKKNLLLNRADFDSVSPDENVRKGLPPTIILQGRTDTVTPLAGAQNFTDKMIEAGNRCELIIYDGVGHLFTPSTMRDDGWPKPDSKIQAAAYARADEFLRSLGYIK